MIAMKLMSSRLLLPTNLLARICVTSSAKRMAHNAPLTYDFARERIMLTLRLFDKIDPEKLTLQSNFVSDLGLDSLDHVEIIMHLEDEFNFEIPDKDAEKLLTPGDILRYITDKEEAYKELQDMESHDHHHGHGHDEGHPHRDGITDGGIHAGHHSSRRSFCTLTHVSKRLMSSGEFSKYPTSFGKPHHTPMKIEEIQERVMKVCSKYDKIDSSKLQPASHFVNDLGLDSLDHVEIMMELEDEFGVEIPDNDAEKLMRPLEIASYIFHKNDARKVEPTNRPY